MSVKIISAQILNDDKRVFFKDAGSGGGSTIISLDGSSRSNCSKILNKVQKIREITFHKNNLQKSAS